MTETVKLYCKKCNLKHIEIPSESTQKLDRLEYDEKTKFIYINNKKVSCRNCNRNEFILKKEKQS